MGYHKFVYHAMCVFAASAGPNDERILMGIMIKALRPELSEDYFDFFDNRAFSDNSPNYPCYCNAFNMSAAQIRSELIEQIEKNGGGAEG